MLESFLGEPESLTDEQVMRLLKLAFDTPAVDEQLTVYLNGSPTPGYSGSMAKIFICQASRRMAVGRK